MIRAGHSWAAGPGERRWVSYPFWVYPAGCLGSGLFWLFVGWWLVPAVLLLALSAWMYAGAALLVISGAAVAWLRWRGQAFRIEVLRLEVAPARARPGGAGGGAGQGR